MGMVSSRMGCVSAAILCGISASSFAADLPTRFPEPQGPQALPSFYAHLGATGLIPDTGARIRLAGRRVPNATIAIPAAVTASLEIGYYLTPNWAVSATVGVPPTSEILGQGTITPLGKLGSTVAGASTLTAHYHFLQLSAFQPYVGGGLAHLAVFDNTDGALSRFRVNGALGAVGQIGADIMITERVGIFVDLKKAYLRTTSRGLFAGLPVKSDVTLDPLALTGGLALRF